MHVYRQNLLNFTLSFSYQKNVYFGTKKCSETRARKILTEVFILHFVLLGKDIWSHGYRTPSFSFLTYNLHVKESQILPKCWLKQLGITQSPTDSKPFLVFSGKKRKRRLCIYFFSFFSLVKFLSILHFLPHRHSTFKGSVKRSSCRPLVTSKSKLLEWLANSRLNKLLNLDFT